LILVSDINQDEEIEILDDDDRLNIFDFLSKCDAHNSHQKRPTYQRSPLFFVEMQELSKFNIDEDRKNSVEVENELFINDSGSFVDFILKRYMPYSMLWSAIVTGKRYANAVGEIFFRVMKHVWHLERNLEVSTFIKSQRDLIRQSVKRYHFETMCLSEKQNQIENLKRIRNHLNQKFKSSTPLVSKNKLSQNKTANEILADNPLSDKQTETWGDSAKRKATSTFSTYLESPFVKKIKLDPKILFNAPEPLIQTPVTALIQNPKAIPTYLPNGLIENPSFYKDLKTKTNFVVGLLDFGKKTPCKLMYNDFKTLNYDDTEKNEVLFWLSGTIVDILLKLKEKRSHKKIVYIDHVDAGKIFNGLGLIDGLTCKSLNINFEGVKYIVSAIWNGHHWYLVFAHVEKKSVVFVDPRNPYKKSENLQWFNNFTKFLQKIKKNTQLDRNDWRLRDLKNKGQLPVQSTSDHYNCGVYILMYVDWLIDKKIENENPLLQRLRYQQTLLESSQNVNQNCLVCGKKNIKIKCIFCSRSVCTACFKKYKLGTEPFVCFLCA
jgi:Ulp1 protease family, C-terminal catalytic domain